MATCHAPLRRAKVDCSDQPLLLPCPMGSLSRPGIALVMILTVLGSGTATAQLPFRTGGPPRPKVFTGPDIGRYFARISIPEYPYEARRTGVSGRGTYRAFVEPNGQVSRVVVIKSTGSGSLDDAVVRAALRWRARPGKKREVDFPMAFIAPPRAPGIH
jgi:TonB family protein